MPTQTEYALFAANVYGSKDLGFTGDLATVRHPNNALPIPDGWTALGAPKVVTWDGFMAQAYQRGNEIVISYAGTTDEDKLDWLAGNVPAATGEVLAPQVFDAAAFYLDVLKANPGATFSFTGHSLGGGLASLMAVYFDRPAMVFDEAPFQKSADSRTVVQQLQSALKVAGYLIPPTFLGYVAVDKTGALVPSPTREARDDQVKQVYIKDEVLSLLSTTQLNLLAVVLGRFVPRLWTTGTGVAKINDGNMEAFDTKAKSFLGWGTRITNGDPVALHSITLLTGFVLSKEFLATIQSYPELLPRLFSGMFKNSPKDKDANLTDLLVQRQYRGEGSLTALVADVNKIDGVQGLTSIKTLPGASAIESNVAAIMMDVVLAGLYAQGKNRRPNDPFVNSFQQVLTQGSGGL